MTNRQLKTVNVRVAVAVDDEGRWMAYGKSGQCEHGNKDTMHSVQFSVKAPSQCFWITAELPIPEPQEIAATVEEVK